MQLGVHLIDTVNYLFDGPPLRVTAVHRHQVMENQDDVTSQILEYHDGILFTLNSYYITHGSHFLNVYGTEANVYSEGSAIRVRTGGGDETLPAVSLPQGTASTMTEMREFGECIRTGRQPEVTAEVGLQALAPVEAAIISSREGRTVDLAEIL